MEYVKTVPQSWPGSKTLRMSKWPAVAQSARFRCLQLHQDLARDTRTASSNHFVGRPSRILSDSVASIMAELWEPSANSAYSHQREEDGLARDLAEIIDLTGEYRHTRSRFVLAPTPPQIPPTQKEFLEEYTCHDGLVLKSGMTVQLKKSHGRYHARFLKIHSIVRDVAGTQPIFRGCLYTRARLLQGMFPKKTNEVVMVADIKATDPRPWKEQSLVDFSPRLVRRPRDMRTTNAPFQQFRSILGHNDPDKTGSLVCRFRFLRYFTENGKQCEWVITRIGEDEADLPFRLNNKDISTEWRGPTRRGGSYVPHEHAIPPDQQYSAGDVFAGAGGVSRGMQMAGAHVVFAVDHWEHATASLQRNFQLADIHDMDVHEFVTKRDLQYRVDLLHLSPPCQVWSPAHTQAGCNDEANEAALFACTSVIQNTRPRLFTLEQTFGILHQQFEEHFHALVHGFTDHGYSVRWKVVNLATYGLPQPRKRLIMIGAGPGEKLPDFPPPTHGTETKPFVTVRQALAPLARLKHHPYHQPTRVMFGTPKQPWNADQPLRNTITTGGGKYNWFWDGTREFTVLEFAVLQGFPVGHHFSGMKTHILKQIGNAFAPSVVEVLYRHLIKSLDQQDGIVRQPQSRTQERTSVRQDSPIVVLDEDDIDIADQQGTPPLVVLDDDDDDDQMMDIDDVGYDPLPEDVDMDRDDRSDTETIWGSSYSPGPPQAVVDYEDLVIDLTLETAPPPPSRHSPIEIID
ncbi:S-adenosyl-L-methionine-dependent methyltransferase [Apodospora peruviana]|uniref:DNA (cytosine-5-)-methyltransferase n=1 Tax=Apodospora peruviana TaxID=516989 RepID=A0AAE0IU72_9PEZI|nr:S-adenosyl-L-methionine-dependent methyltransferase [Apodospora peruviana]